MGIDGIGKPPGGAPGAPQGVTTPSAPAQNFRVGEAAAPSPTQAAGSDELSALARGELTVEQYLDARVEGAVAPLVSRLSTEQLDYVRAELRAALESDPVLVELVQKTVRGASVG